MKKLRLFICLLPALYLLACKDHAGAEKSEGPTNAQKDVAIREQFMKANQQVALKENDEMDDYGKRHKMPFVKTGSGIRYFVYKPSANGDSVRQGMEISMNYQVSLLDGTECYSSKTDGPLTFMVGKKENLESGVHKGVQYLKRGDKAVLLIPSVLAHGLLGDFKKIPPQMPIVYDVEIY